jgi:surface polysaccharide O-acyltransferase-like enzyme
MKVKEKVENSELVESKNINSEVVKDEKSKRDVSVDLIRIVACITVICTHLCLQVLNRCYNRIDWSRLLEKSFFTDGVPLFFMITGFFIVNGRSYKKIWKSTLKKVLLPSFIYVLFAQVFYMFILNKQSFIWCVQNAIANLNLQGILKSILTGDVTPINSLCEHLWYIYSYIKIIIWVPILWLVCKEEKNSKLARRIILGFGILGTIITDIQRFVTLPVIGSIKVFELVDRELIYVLLGYELFVHKDKLKGNKKVCIDSLIGFVIINFIRYKLEIKYMVINSLTDIVGRENFMEWRYTCLNIFSGLCLFAFLYSFEIKGEKISKILKWISDNTFGIYLIHYLILAKVDLYKFEKIEKFPLEILYLIIGLIVTFIASTIIVVLIKKFVKLLEKLFRKELSF